MFPKRVSGPLVLPHNRPLLTKVLLLPFFSFYGPPLRQRLVVPLISHVTIIVFTFTFFPVSVSSSGLVHPWTLGTVVHPEIDTFLSVSHTRYWIQKVPGETYEMTFTWRVHRPFSSLQSIFGGCNNNKVLCLLPLNLVLCRPLHSFPFESGVNDVLRSRREEGTQRWWDRESGHKIHRRWRWLRLEELRSWYKVRKDSGALNWATNHVLCVRIILLVY